MKRGEEEAKTLMEKLSHLLVRKLSEKLTRIHRYSTRIEEKI